MPPAEMPISPAVDPAPRREAKALLDRGELTASIALYRQLLEATPDDVALRTNLGVALHRSGNLTEAIECFRAAAKHRPDLAVVQANLGLLLAEAGDRAGAIIALDRALARDAAQPDWACKLAELRETAGDPAGAELALDRALATDPSLPAPLAARADLRYRRGKLDAATSDYRAILEMAPATAPAWNALGLIASVRGDNAAALDCFRRAVACAPDLVPALINLGSTLIGRHAYTEALDMLEHALDNDPDSAAAHLNHSVALLNQGRAPEAARAAHRAHILDPGTGVAMSNFLSALQYDPDRDAASRAEAARAWGGHIETQPRIALPARPRDPDRKLKLGYVSGDFRGHPVGIYLTAVLPHHDRTRFEIVCYSNNRQRDAISEKLIGAADRWVDITAIDDAALAAQMAADGIDILIDLSGHTAAGRPGVFARKPAPLQIGWIGYFATTGLSTVDRVIADERLIPSGETAQFTERPLYLPDTYVTFAAPSEAPAPASPPCFARGHVTFGCFNNAAKLGPAVIRLWAALLARIPTARLVLRTGAFGDPGTVARFSALFREAGADPARIEFAGHARRAALLAAYNEIDVALDPFPFNGGITSVEALWMGVPVVTKRGDRYCGHHSESSLVALGLGDLVAADDAGYLQTAASLAADRVRLAALRADLRDRFARSTLGDNPRFVRDLEAGLRRAWAEYCAGGR
ncbi:MAG: tetratricopeptide repeat protein [Dongiaceae bacterium]